MMAWEQFERTNIEPVYEIKITGGLLPDTTRKIIPCVWQVDDDEYQPGFVVYEGEIFFRGMSFDLTFDKAKYCEPYAREFAKEEYQFWAKSIGHIEDHFKSILDGYLGGDE